MEKTNEILYVTVFALILIVGLAIPLVVGILADTHTVGSTYSEYWTGTALTPSALTYPITGVTTNYKAGVVSSYNDTALLGANSTRSIPLLTPLVSSTFNVTVKTNLTAGENISVSVGACTLGNISSASDTWNAISRSCLVTPLVVTFHNGQNGTHSNITNVSVAYGRWVAYPNYTISGGAITPVASGYFDTAYTYGNANEGVYLILALVPILLALLMLAIIMHFATEA